MKLWGYWRSSAAFRVRIALRLKGIDVEEAYRHLRKGEQRSPDYLDINPQGLVPSLELDGGEILTQSLAIIEWLDETFPGPRFLPEDPIRRAHVRAFAMSIACEIHPLQNTRILARLRREGFDEAHVTKWIADTIRDGFAESEKLLAREKGPFCFGASPTLADICLVPQMYNARRYEVDLGPMNRLREAEAAALAHPAFRAALPEAQPDAE